MEKLGTGNPADIHYGSYHRYTMQFTEAKTRNIYREKSGKMSLCYQDQSSSLRVSHTFCPVGTKFTKDHIDLGIKFNGKIKGTNKSKNEILQLANQYANRGAKVVFGVTGTSLKESWK